MKNLTSQVDKKLFVFGVKKDKEPDINVNFSERKQKETLKEYAGLNKLEELKNEITLYIAYFNLLCYIYHSAFSEAAYEKRILSRQ